MSVRASRCHRMNADGLTRCANRTVSLDCGAHDNRPTAARAMASAVRQADAPVIAEVAVTGDPYTDGYYDRTPAPPARLDPAHAARVLTSAPTMREELRLLTGELRGMLRDLDGARIPLTDADLSFKVEDHTPNDPNTTAYFVAVGTFTRRGHTYEAHIEVPSYRFGDISMEGADVMVNGGKSKASKKTYHLAIRTLKDAWASEENAHARALMAAYGAAVQLGFRDPAEWAEEGSGAAGYMETLRRGQCALVPALLEDPKAAAAAAKLAPTWTGTPAELAEVAATLAG